MLMGANNALAFDDGRSSTTRECKAENRITLESTSKNHHPSPAFILSDNYCIRGVVSSNMTDESLLPDTSVLASRSEIIELRFRYRQAYETLKSDKQKVAFVDLFLQEATHSHYVTHSGNSNMENVRVTFYRLSGTERGYVGEAIRLFAPDGFNKKLASQYLKLVSTNKGKTKASKKLIALVDYALKTPKKSS